MNHYETDSLKSIKVFINVIYSRVNSFISFYFCKTIYSFDNRFLERSFLNLLSISGQNTRTRYQSTVSASSKSQGFLYIDGRKMFFKINWKLSISKEIIQKYFISCLLLVKLCIEYSNFYNFVLVYYR